MKSWYRIENKADEVATIYVYDEISAYGVAANQFVNDLNGIKAKSINLRINSPGGNVFDGAVIHNALKEHPATVNVKIDGLAASIASIIAMAGDTIHMADNAMMMIHKAWTVAVGNADDMQQTAEVLTKIDNTLVKTYSDRTGQTQRNVRQLMSDETWLTAQEAKDLGFADTIGDSEDANASFDLAKYAKVPASVLARFGKQHNDNTERDVERLLRDAGVSKKAALAAVAAIKGESRRDSEDDEAEKLKAYLQSEVLKTIIQ